MTPWGRRITYCVNLQDRVSLAAGVEEEIRVSLKVLALKVNLQAQVYSFTPNDILQEPEPSKVA